MSSDEVINVLYKDKELPKLKFIEQGDWVDTYVSRIQFESGFQAGEVKDAAHLSQFDYAKLYLGFCMELPEGEEAWVVPRSSTFRKKGLILCNSMGIIDNSFKGELDEWFVPVLAMRDTYIKKGDCLFQFRTAKKQPIRRFSAVKHFDGNENRGSDGSTDK